VSVRLAKGVYYRIGAFKGYPVERTEQVRQGVGPLAVTNKHLYFTGGPKSFRIRHDKIVALEPYLDGVVVTKDGVRAKPQVFLNGDGWFLANLLSGVSQIEASRPALPGELDQLFSLGSADLYPDVDRLLRAGKRIQAVKTLREQAGLTLAQAKEKIDSRARQLGP
jgi:hypothetical protein